MAIISPSERLLILACSATKKPGAKYMPAIERYDGPLWHTLRTINPHGRKAKVAFLSAKLGFRAVSVPIEIYDARMTATMAYAMKAGDLGTRWPRPRTQARVMAEGEHPGMHTYSLTVGTPSTVFRDVALVGGHLYIDVMHHLTGRFRNHGHIAADARIHEINGPIGIMRQDLRLWLDGEYREER